MVKPAFVGKLGRLVIVFCTVSAGMGTLITLSFIADHLDFGKRNNFWNCIFVAINVDSTSERVFRHLGWLSKHNLLAKTLLA